MESKFVDAIADLRKKVWGSVCLPDDAEFAIACQTWVKPATPIIPSVVVRCRGVTDVQAALKFARDHGLEVAVKGQGHHSSHLCLVEGGMVIDLSLMRGVFVDPMRKLAMVQGGCLLGDIDTATAVYDLAVPLGHAPITGMGLALGGGMGVLMHVFGATCQHIVAATLVLADGTVVDVDADSDPELLWGLRGAGAALGVATSLTFRLHDVSSTYGGVLKFHDDPGHQNWRTIARFIVETREVENYSCFVVRSPTPAGPMLLMQVVYLGEKSIEEKTAFLEPLRKLGPVVDTIAPGNYLGTQFMMLEGLRMKQNNPLYEYWISGQTQKAQMNEDFFDRFCGLIHEIPEAAQPYTGAMFGMWKPPGAETVGKASDGPCALLTSTADFGWGFVTCWQDPAARESVMAFCDQAREQLAEKGDVDVYANVSAVSRVDATDQRLAARVGGTDNLQRLRALKARVDPTNVFKSHQMRGLKPAL